MFGLGHGHALTLAASRPLTVPFVGPLNDWKTDGVEFHSIYQRLLTSFTGDLFQVRRSLDDEPLWIPALPSGLFDSALLLSFCAGTDGYVAAVSGQLNGYHLIQPTASLQRRIVTAGALETFDDGSPCMRATAADTQGYYTDTFTAQTSVGASVFAIADYTSGSAVGVGLASIVTASGWDYYGNACGLSQQSLNARIAEGQGGAAIDFSFGTKFVSCASFDGTNSTIRVNNLTASAAYTGGLSNVQRILAAGARSAINYYSGSSDGWQAQAVYLDPKTADQLAIMAALEGSV